MIPAPDEVLKALAPITPAVYAAIEAGVQSARDFFETRDAPIDPYHGPSIVRWEAKRFLDTHGHEVADAAYAREDIANNGLRVLFGHHVIWILKSDNGELPAPGPSEIKQRFYSQQAFDFMNSDDVEPPLALVILWGVTPDYHLKPLLLVCPEAGDSGKTSVSEYWTVKIPHPANAVEPPPIPDDDLDITLDSDQ